LLESPHVDVAGYTRFMALSAEEKQAANSAAVARSMEKAPKLAPTPPTAEEIAAAAEAAAAAAQAAQEAKAAKEGAAAAAAAAAAAVHPDSLSGKRFVVMGGFARGKYRVESSITDAGGVLTKSVAKSVAYVVCGTPEPTAYGGVSGPGSKAHREAKKLRIPIVDETAFQKLLDAHAAQIAAQQSDSRPQVADGLSPLVGGSAASPALAAADLGAVFLDICRMRHIEVKAAEAAQEARIAEAEQLMRVALPPYLKSLLRVTDGSSEQHPQYLFPSVRTLCANAGGLAAAFRAKGLKYIGLGEVEQNTDAFLDVSRSASSAESRAELVSPPAGCSSESSTDCSLCFSLLLSLVR
jgi:hypothetical protein